MTLPAHAKLAPSGADMWMNCPGSVEAQEGLPDISTEFAAEGTAAHDVSDFCLSYDMHAADLIGVRYKVPGLEEVRNFQGLITGYAPRTYHFQWDEEDAEFLQPGLDWIRSLGGEFYGEHKVDISNWLGEGQFGTLDRGVVLADDDAFAVADLKWGRGIPVNVKTSKQLRLYALGFWWNVARYFVDTRRVLLAIDQPRSWIEGGVIELSLDELLAFGDEVKPAAERALKPGAERIPSPTACYWCKRRKALGGCYAYDEWMFSVLGITPADLKEIGDILMNKVMTADQRANLALHASLIEKWIEKQVDDALQYALSKGEAGGVKVIEGRKLPDKWKDKPSAETVLREKLGDRRFGKPPLLTPLQALNLLSDEDAKEVEALISRGIKKPTFVSADDPRPSIKSITDQIDEMEDF